MNHSTRRLSLAALVGAGLVAMMANTPAAAWDRGNVETFAVLPAGSTGPEGITIGPEGVYVTTFGFNATGQVAGPGQLFVFRENDGKLIRQVSVMGSSPHLLGLGFNPAGQLLVIDFGNGNVRLVDPQTGNSSVCFSVTGASGLNDLTFDSAGNTYVSDSFQGIIWKKAGPCDNGVAAVWVSSTLLQTTGTPPFGANGLRFNKTQTAMFVANTGNDQVIKIPVTAGTPGTPAVFVNSINGADGLIMDSADNLWVAANQEDEIVVVDQSPKAIAKLGDFDGIAKNGTPRGLLFPASLVFSKDRQWLFVTNLALDIRLFGLPPSIDSNWTSQVKNYTVSRIKARIPPFPAN